MSQDNLNRDNFKPVGGMQLDDGEILLASNGGNVS